jgi:putative copper export protein
MASTGALSWCLWVLPRSVDPGGSKRSPSCRHAARTVLLVALATLTITTPCLLLTRTAEMAGRSIVGAVPLVPKVLSATHYGSVWLVRAGALMLLWVGLWAGWRQGPKGPLALTSILVLVIAWSYSASGHASTLGDFSLLQITDTLHIASAAIWVGGLIVLCVLRRPLLSGAARGDPVCVAETARRLSRLATLALIVVVVTGTYNATVQIDHVSALWETGYGRLLMLKLAAVLAMIALGAVNRLQGLARLQACARRSPKAADLNHGAPPAVRRFWRIGAFEAILALGVLILTTLITREMPPRQTLSASNYAHAAVALDARIRSEAAHGFRSS